MEIENYREKRKKKQITLDFAESGRIAVFERKYREEDGVPVVAARGETDADSMNADVDEAKKKLGAQQAFYDDLVALAADVKAKEDERDKIAKGNEKKKEKK